MKFLFYFSISVLYGHETSVLACIFNKDTSQAWCRACAAGRGPHGIPSALWGGMSMSPADTLSLGLTAQGHGPGRGWLFLSGSASQAWNSPRSLSATFDTSVRGYERQGGGRGSLGAIQGTQASPSASGGPVVKVVFLGWQNSTALRGPQPASSSLWKEVRAVVYRVKLGFWKPFTSQWTGSCKSHETPD